MLTVVVVGGEERGGREDRRFLEKDTREVCVMICIYFLIKGGHGLSRKRARKEASQSWKTAEQRSNGEEGEDQLHSILQRKDQIASSVGLGEGRTASFDTHSGSLPILLVAPLRFFCQRKCHPHFSRVSKSFVTSPTRLVSSHLRPNESTCTSSLASLTTV